MLVRRSSGPSVRRGGGGLSAEGEEVVRFDIADEFSARRTCQSTLRIGRATAIAPAVFKRCTTRASLSGRQSLNFGSPQVVGRPVMLNCSLPVTGNPSSGLRSPRASAASAAAAVVRARSKSRTTTALILGSSASIRAIAASSNSRAETVRSMRAALSSCGRRMSDPRPPPLGYLVADHPQPRPQTQSGRYVGWGRWSSKPLPRSSGQPVFRPTGWSRVTRPQTILQRPCRRPRTSSPRRTSHRAAFLRSARARSCAHPTCHKDGRSRLLRHPR